MYFVVCSLGAMYFEGDGVEQDKERAASLWASAAAGGSGLGLHSLGRLYYDGNGVDQDRERAVELWEEAVSKGHRGARGDLERAHLEQVCTCLSLICLSWCCMSHRSWFHSSLPSHLPLLASHATFSHTHLSSVCLLLPCDSTLTLCSRTAPLIVMPVTAHTVHIVNKPCSHRVKYRLERRRMQWQRS